MTAATARKPGPIVAARAKQAPPDSAQFRPDELRRLMIIRHGRRLPHDETGARFRDRMLDTLSLLGSKGRHRAEHFLSWHCKWMTPAQRAEAIDTAFALQRLWSAEDLGNDLDVTEAEHTQARIKTFRIAGMTDAALRQRNLAKDAAYQSQKRAQKRLLPKLPKLPNASERRQECRFAAVLDALPRNGDVLLTDLCWRIRQAKNNPFLKVSETSLPRVVRRVIERDRSGLITTDFRVTSDRPDLQAPMWVKRSTTEEEVIVPTSSKPPTGTPRPTTPAEYRKYFEEKLATFVSETAAKGIPEWLFSPEEQQLLAACGVDRKEFFEIAKARRRHLLWLINGLIEQLDATRKA